MMAHILAANKKCVRPAANKYNGSNVQHLMGSKKMDVSPVSIGGGINLILPIIMHAARGLNLLLHILNKPNMNISLTFL